MEVLIPFLNDKELQLFVYKDEDIIKYKDEDIKIELLIDKTKNTLELIKFYRKDYKIKVENKGYGKRILFSIVKTLLNKEYINLKTIFTLETEFNCSNKIKRYYKSMSFKTSSRNYYKRFEVIDIYYKMKTNIINFLNTEQ